MANLKLNACMKYIILLIVIRLSDGDIKPGSLLGAFQEEQAMSRHRVSPSLFLSSSSHTTQLGLHYTNNYTYSHPNLNFLQHRTDTLPIGNVVCPSGAWFENRPHLMPSIRLARNPKRITVQWVGIRTDRQEAKHMCSSIELWGLANIVYGRMDREWLITRLEMLVRRTVTLTQHLL